MAISLNPQVVRAVVLAGSVAIAMGAVAAPRQVAELSLHALQSHPKWMPKRQPLFGNYLASGVGEASGAFGGHVFWDLYEDQSQDDRHPAFFRGFLERDGRRYPFEIIGIYSPESVDGQRWRISGVVTFADKGLLGTTHEPLTGSFDASTRTSRFTIWAERSSE
jgi:hypothetical protein